MSVMVVPETPEGGEQFRRNRRRSRISTATTKPSSSIARKTIDETFTPTSALASKFARQTLIEESPESNSTPQPMIAERAANLGVVTTVSNNKVNSEAISALFGFGGFGRAVRRNNRSPPPPPPTFLSEETFVNYVAGTQDLASTRIEDENKEVTEKIEEWLQEGSEAERINPTVEIKPPEEKRKKNRRSSVMIGRRKGPPPPPPPPATPTPKSGRRKSSSSVVVVEQKENVEKTPSIPVIPKERILEGIVAFTDVGNPMLADFISERLRSLGAETSKTLKKGVTHVVFEDGGSLAMYNKAKKLGCHIVSNMWVEVCKNSGKRINEKDYPTDSKEKYDLGLFIPKKKRNFFVSSERRQRRLILEERRLEKRIKMRKKKLEEEFAAESKAIDDILPTTPCQKTTPTLLDQILETDKIPSPWDSSPKNKGTPNNDDDDDEEKFGDLYTPLSVRVAKNFFAERRRRNSADKNDGSLLLEDELRKKKNSKRKLPGENDDEDEDEKSSEEKKNPPLLKEDKKPIRRRRHLLFSQKDELMAETPQNSPLLETKKTKNKIPSKSQKKEIPSSSIKEDLIIKPPRRSSVEFVVVEKSRKKSLKNNKRFEMVFTSCSRDDVQLAEQLISKLGIFSIGKSVSRTTTHVITTNSDENRRTLTILRGILRGTWIISKDWLYACLEDSQWVDEEPYEKVDFSRAVRTCRIERQSFGSYYYESRLFREIGSVYISRKEVSVPAHQLGELIRLGGGKVTPKAEVADVTIIGTRRTIDDDQNNKGICVNEKWILDSVQHNFLMPFSDYLIK